MKTNPNEFDLACDSSFNAIGYKVSLVANRELVIKLANVGLEKVVGAKPSSTLDQKLGYNPTMAKDVKRPDGWRREMIQFSEANAAGLKAEFIDYLKKAYDVDATVETFQAQRQDAFKEARTVFANLKAAMPAEMLATWAKTIGYNGDGELNEDNLELLAAIAANNAKVAPAKSK